MVKVDEVECPIRGTPLFHGRKSNVCLLMRGDAETKTHDVTDGWTYLEGCIRDQLRGDLCDVVSLQEILWPLSF